MGWLFGKQSAVVLEPRTDTFVPLSQAGKVERPYRPTYAFSGSFINDHHAFYATCPLRGNCIDIGIRGWLQPDDALKLYELAYFAEGDILELGCCFGLSTFVMAEATFDSGRKRRIVSNDIAPGNIRDAERMLTDRSLQKRVTFCEGDSAAVCRDLQREGRTFGVVFIDHSHTEDAVRSVAEVLSSIVQPGGFCFFHDYNNALNADPANAEYGVWQGVEEGLPKEKFTFYGVFGCAALYRRMS